MQDNIEFVAFVGLDWDSQQHAACILPAVGGKPQHREVPQTPEAIAQWVAELRERFPEGFIAVCLEQARGALVYALMQYDFLVLYPINPKQLSDYREALYPSGAKSDPNDAELLARFLREHADKLRAWRPDDAITRELRFQTEERRTLVEERVACTNRLQQRLNESYPLALQWAGQDLCSEVFLTVLERFPAQRELQRASPQQLERWLPKLRVADPETKKQRLTDRMAAIRNALPMTTDAAVLGHARLAILNLVRLIRVLNRAVADVDQRIAELFSQHPDSALFASFPGAGKALAPRLAAAFGTDRDKFESAQDIQQLSGIAPVTKASGKSKVVHMRWACPKFMRQTFHEFAGCSIKFSVWAKAYFRMRKARGHRHQEIVRGLAFKWQRIIFRCWQARENYDEARYLQRLHDTNSPLIPFLNPEPATTA
jgi:transposase